MNTLLWFYTAKQGAATAAVTAGHQQFEGKLYKTAHHRAGQRSTVEHSTAWHSMSKDTAAAQRLPDDAKLDVPAELQQL